MIGYVMVGTNDLTKATKFYDTILVPLGLCKLNALQLIRLTLQMGQKTLLNSTLPFPSIKNLQHMEMEQ